MYSLHLSCITCRRKQNEHTWVGKKVRAESTKEENAVPLLLLFTAHARFCLSQQKKVLFFTHAIPSVLALHALITLLTLKGVCVHIKVCITAGQVSVALSCVCVFSFLPLECNSFLNSCAPPFPAVILSITSSPPLPLFFNLHPLSAFFCFF